MARRRKMGAISTQTMLLLGGAGVALYFLTRPKTTTMLPSGTIFPTAAPGPTTAQVQAQASEVNTAITQGAGTIQDLFNQLLGG